VCGDLRGHNPEMCPLCFAPDADRFRVRVGVVPAQGGMPRGRDWWLQQVGFFAMGYVAGQVAHEVARLTGVLRYISGR